MLEVLVLFLLVSVFLFFVLGIQAYWSDKRSEVLVFCALLFSVFVWGISLVFFTGSQKDFIALFSSRLVWASAPFMANFLFIFSLFFPKSIFYNKSKVYSIAYVSLFLSFLLGLISLLSGGVVVSVDIENRIMFYGELYYIQSGLIGLYVLFSILIMSVQRGRESGRSRKLTSILLTGFLLTGVGGIFTNIILPNIAGSSIYSSLGVVSTLPGVLSIAYAIIKYRLFDIRLLLGRAIYYGIIALLFIIAYFAIFLFDNILFGGSDTTWGILTGPIKAVTFAAFFVKFNDYIRTQVRTRVINPGYDPLEFLDKLSRHVAQLLKTSQISNEAMTVLHQTIRADYEAIYVSTSDDNKKEFLVEYEHRAKDLDKEMLNEVFKIWSSSSRSPIVYQELEYEMPTKFLGTPDLVKEVYEFMKSENLRVILPLRDTDENAGMLILGQKEADSSYSVQDIEFIQGVATTVGLAVTRAFYYEEVQDLNRNLQKRVEEATEELQGKNARLEKALKKIEDIRQQERDMIDVMGHELRTPITIVRNALLVLQAKLKDRKRVETKSVKEYVEKAVESARREINLVETLLSATKVESNRIQLTLTKIDMLDVVNDSIEGHKGFAKDKKIKIDYKKPKKKIYGFADRTRIQEVMDNFLSNAIKYTMRGKVEISVKTDKEYSYISITDTGIGISKDDLKHLGKKFFRAKQYLKNDDGETNDVVRPGGTGLGLYVSFNLVRLMDGEVEVESEIGKGSTFTLKVPKYDGQKDKHIDQTFEEPI